MRLINIFLFLLCTSYIYAEEITLSYPTKEVYTKDGKLLLTQVKHNVKKKTYYTVIVSLLKHKSAKLNKHYFPFRKSSISFSSQFKGAKDLLNYYTGYSVKNNILRIGFSNEALRYLNNTISVQECIGGSIISTIKYNFPNITEIKYFINGKELTDGDA
jgi:hypothetical protein